MFIVPRQLDSTNNETTLNKNANPQIIICYGDTPPEYEGELLTYIDRPPKYEEQPTLGTIPIKTKSKPTKKNTEDALSNRKGKWCYSTESIESRCCGACYWLCHPTPHKEPCECCPNTFCDFWKSGYIQTTGGYGTYEEDRCEECECDDCFWTTVCFPCKVPLFVPCFLGSLFNEGINKVCGSNRNYLF